MTSTGWSAGSKPRAELEGVFTTDDLLDCYREGVFPMADARHDKKIFLVDPTRRGVLPLDSLKISRRLARTVRSDRFEVRVDSDFEGVIAACAAPRPGRLETWINGSIEWLCTRLNQNGFAHSIETWREGRMVGGLYGIAIGGAFFGESMFSIETDASKVALVHLVSRLRFGGFSLLDAQFLTDHLTTLGAVEISRADYRDRLAEALKLTADFGRMPIQTVGAAALHATSQRS